MKAEEAGLQDGELARLIIRKGKIRHGKIMMA